MKKEKHAYDEGIEKTAGQKLKETDVENGYKYLGILEAESVKGKKRKENKRWII